MHYGIEFNDHYLRQQRRRLGDRDRLRQRGRARQRSTTTASSSAPRSRARHLAGADRGSQERRAPPRTGPTPPRSTSRSPSPRTRTSSSCCASTTSRTTPAASCRSRPRRAQAAVDPTTGAYTGPTLSLSWNNGRGHRDRLDAAHDGPEHRPRHDARHLHRASRAGPHRRRRQHVAGARPTPIRIGSSTGATEEAPVTTWLGGGLPPMADGYLKDFTTRYMDPTEVYGAVRRAGGGVPEHLRADHAAEQDERLPAQGAGAR